MATNQLVVSENVSTHDTDLIFYILTLNILPMMKRYLTYRNIPVFIIIIVSKHQNILLSSSGQRRCLTMGVVFLVTNKKNHFLSILPKTIPLCLCFI